MAVNYDGGSIGSFGFLAGIQRPNFSFSYVDDFFHANDEDWTLKQIAGSGTFARIDGHGGVALIDNAANTATHASQLGMKGIVDLSQGDAAFEASGRVSSDASTSTLSTTNDGTGLIVGLAVDSDDVDAFASSGNAFGADDFVGFRHGDVGKLDAVCRVNDTETTVTDVVEITGAVGVTGFVRLGFMLRGSQVSFFVDGELVGRITTNIPNAAVGETNHAVLGPIFAVANDDSGVQGKLAIDYVAIAGSR